LAFVASRNIAETTAHTLAAVFHTRGDTSCTACASHAMRAKFGSDDMITLDMSLVVGAEPITIRVAV
jgi:hypothetical protein